MVKKKVHVISDIDGTLTTHPEFVGYNVSSNPCVIDFLQKKSEQGAHITYLSARNEFMRNHTLQWFEQNHVPQGNLLLDAPMSEQRGKIIIPTLCQEDETCIYLDDNEKARLAAKQALTNHIQVLDPSECDKFNKKT